MPDWKDEAPIEVDEDDLTTLKEYVDNSMAFELYEFLQNMENEYQIELVGRYHQVYTPKGEKVATSQAIRELFKIGRELVPFSI